MSILRLEPNTSKSINENYLYLTNPEKTDRSTYFGIGVDVDIAYLNMNMIKNIYKRNYKHEYVDVYLSLAKNEYCDIPLFKNICQNISSILIDIHNFQLFGVIHYLNTDHIHSHFMINKIGINGKQYRQENHILYYRNIVSNILISNGLSPIA